MVTNADYAAYSRATGTPYPQNQEEQIELYPMVRNWRNNQLKQEGENNIGQNIAVGALGLGALALGSVAGRRALAQRQAQRKSSGGGGRRGGVGFQDNPPAPPKDPSGGGGSPVGNLPSVTRQGAFNTAAEKYPDPGVGKDVQYRNPGSGGTDMSMLITDPVTGEIYRAGGGQSMNQIRVDGSQQQASTQGGINLAKQNLGGPYGKTTVQNGFLEAMRNSNTQLGEITAANNLGETNYVRNRIASQLEAAPQSVGPNIQMRDLPPASAVKAQPTTEGINPEKAARIERNRQKNVARVADMIFDAIDNDISEGYSVPENISQLAKRAEAGVINEQDVNTFRTYIQDAYKNDPAILREMNEELSFFTPPATPPAKKAIKDRVNQFMSEISVGDSGEMLAGPEVAAEARQMSGTESSRQAAAVRRLEKQEESLAKNILSELAAESPTLTENYEAVSEPAARIQNIEALNTAEDQSDGRFLRQLQRNEDIDMSMVNEDVIDAANTQTAQDALFRENQLVQDARDYLIRQEIDLKYDYTPEESRQAAAVGQALERIQNNPKRVAAEGIIDELRTEARAVADRAKFAKERRQGKTGELPGYREADNIRQRKEQRTLPEIGAPRETIESVLTGEDAPIETNLQGRQLRGGKVDEAGDVRFYGAGSETTDAGTGARVGKQGEKYKPKAQLEARFNSYSDDELEQIASNKSSIAYGDMLQQDLDELQTAQRVLKKRAQTSIDKGVDMSGPQYRALSRGRKGLEASEASRKRFENQRPVPPSQPVQDVARSMETLRQGMSVEPSEAAPVIPDIRNIGIGFEGDKEIIGSISPSDVYTGAARDAAGPVLFTGKNKRDSAVVGTSPPLIQGDIVSNPEVAAQIEDQSQAFLQRAIGGGLTQKANPGVEVYETPRIIGPAEVAGPGSVPLSRTAAPSPEMGPDPSQRTGYARYTSTSKPVGTPSTGARTVGINYAELPSVIDPNRDIGRARYQGPVQTSAERLAAATGGTARPMSMLPDRGDGRTTISIQPPAYDPRYKTAGAQVEKYPVSEVPTRTVYRDTRTGYDYITNPLQQQLSDQAVTERVQAGMPQPIGPLTRSPGLSKIGRQVREGSGYYAGPGQKESTYLTQYGQNIRYPNMRGEERFTTEQLMNDPNLRGGPVKMPNRFRDQFVVERPRGY